MSHRIARRTALGATLAALAAPRPGRAAMLGRNARIILGFPPGGAADIVCRQMAERLAGPYAPQVVVENRTGAGGRLAVEAVKPATPDGTTILFTAESILTIYPHVFRRLGYDAERDFVPVSNVTAFGFGYAVAADHPAKDLPGFAAWARAQPQPVPYATPAAGSGMYFAAEQMRRAFDMPMTHVSYRGMMAAYPDLYAGRLALGMSVIGDLAEQAKGGRLRVLAVTTPERSPSLPDVPTMTELGQPALTAEEFFGVLLPAGTPAPVVTGLFDALRQVFAREDMRAAMARIEERIVVSNPADYAARIKTETQRWGPIIKASGFQVEE